MSKIKNIGLDQYGAEPFEQQQFGTAGVEGVKRVFSSSLFLCKIRPRPDVLNMLYHLMFITLHISYAGKVGYCS